MKLPNGDRAVIPVSKLVSYLLSETHPVGRTKAQFFRAIGFTRENAAALHQALLEVAREGDVTTSEQSPFGTKHVVEGMLPTPRGGRVRLRTVWIVEAGQDLPRLVTAYPLSADQQESSDAE